MKKLLCLLLAVMLLFAFAACDEDATSKAERTEKSENSKITDEETTKEPVTEEKPSVEQPGTTEENATEPTVQEGEPIIISVTVYHGDGEITENRMSAIKGDMLSDVLLTRTFITEDMLTVDGERAYPERGITWSLYIDGVFTTATWDTIPVDNGVEYSFEYTAEIEMEGDTDIEGEPEIEEVPDEL